MHWQRFRQLEIRRQSPYTSKCRASLVRWRPACLAATSCTQRTRFGYRATVWAAIALFASFWCDQSRLVLLPGRWTVELGDDERVALL